MSTTASTTARLLRLLSLLQMRRDWPGTALADRLEISDRTVRRDIDRLRDLGYSIHATMGPDGGYRLVAGAELPPLLFDDEQVIALAIALQSATATGAEIGEGAVRALTTVRQVMPSRLRHRLDAMRFATVAAPTNAVRPDVLVALSMAARAHEVLRFDYSDGDDAAPPRRVEPHSIAALRGHWYLIGWDLDRDGWRVFRADRVSPRSPTGPRFAPRALPGGDVREYLEGRFKGSEQGGDWPCRGSVILHRPAADVAPFIADGTLIDLGPDRCSLELGAWSWITLAASFGRFDAAMDVLGPPELAAGFAELASRYASAALPLGGVE